ncbi:TetR/AcrR family transcriptional regulator C-terminal domain-containing protein [Streptomyces sp. NPDC101455]|uniref:TetR/AcrR family transcriptional regulator C-terminal domain-containing protein n=1 Tax=Streptomyces sp. NPDC101455 TaxID=3366142 RepID=UPI003823ED88
MPVEFASTVLSYVLGEALEQQGLPDDARDKLTFPGAHRTYPHLFSTPVGEILNFDDRFEFGLPAPVSENISPLSSTREAPRLTSP